MQQEQKQQVYIGNPKYLDAKKKYSIQFEGIDEINKVYENLSGKEGSDKQINCFLSGNSTPGQTPVPSDSKYSLSKYAEKPPQESNDEKSPGITIIRKPAVELINQNEIPLEDDLQKPKKPF